MAQHTGSRFKQLQDFLAERGIVERKAGEIPWWLRHAHFGLVTAKAFVRNRLLARASALAYTTLLALVPMLAVAIGVSTSLLKGESEKHISNLIETAVSRVAPQLDLEVKNADGTSASSKRQEVVEKINTFLKNIKSGTLGTTGTIGLVFVAIMLLTNIEGTFNDIWGVAVGRTWMLRIVNYWAVITLGPLLLVVLIGLSSAHQVTSVKEFVTGVPLVSFLLKVLTFLIPSIGFTVFYKLIPNTKVEWSAALFGGVVGGVLWQLNNIFNVAYVSNVVTYSKIYGSLAVLPVFLIGLYFSWAILLFGAQVGYVFQNREIYLDARRSENVNQRGREFVAFRLMVLVATRFASGGAVSSIELSRELDVPTQLVANLLGQLHDAGLVQAVDGPGGKFVPGRPLAQINLALIEDALRSGNGKEIETREDNMRDAIRAERDRIEAAERAVAASITLEELVKRFGRTA